MMKSECPRCHKRVAVLRGDSQGRKVFRHKDPDGLWCSGIAKSSRELILDVFHALQDQRDALHEYAEEVIRHTEECVRLSDKHTAASQVTTARIQQVVDALAREVADAGHAARRA